MKPIRNRWRTLACTMLVLSAAGCGRTMPMARYLPQIQPPAPTINQMGPAVMSQSQQPTLPDGKQAKAMEFDLADGPKEVKVPLGTTKTFHVKITLDDDTQLEKYSKVNWVSTQPDVGTINPDGVFTPLQEGTTKILASIGGVAATMTVVVSEGKYIWSQTQTPTKADLYAVKMVNDTEAWAVGASGTIMHYFRGTWYDLTVPSRAATGGASLYGIDMVSPYEGWIVGENVILRLTNGRVFKVPSPVTGSFKSIDMLGPYIGWIVGDNGGESLSLRFDGRTGWQAIPTNISGALNSVSVVGPNAVWAAGASGKFRRPGIYRFSGEEWQKEKFTDSMFDLKVIPGNYNIKAIKMLNSTQGWAVGEYDPLLSSLRGKRGAMFTYDAVKGIWEEAKLDIKADDKLQQITFNNIGMLAGNKGWILGNTVTAALDFSPNNELHGNLMQTDGSKISVATDFQAQAMVSGYNGIDLLENGNGLIVGNQGLVMHHQYDINYRRRQSNFSNFNGEFGFGYDGTNNPGTNPQAPQMPTL